MAKLYTCFYAAFFTLGFIWNIRRVESGGCPHIFEYARQECGYPGITQGDCETQGCCWDENAQSTFVRCYNKACKAGYFGWGCRFECSCGGQAACNSQTGECPGGCDDNSWGVGCMLDNTCLYNDPSGSHYMGKQKRTEHGRFCGQWTLQASYPDGHFPDKSRETASSFCRNPEPTDERPWCYYAFARKRKWDYCELSSCECPTGRFGVNCDNECHCRNHQEVCHNVNGTCSSGCDHRWQGPSCQECHDGRWGQNCQHLCHCNSVAEVCNKKTGRCRTGCAPGWTGPDCQTGCADGWFGYHCDYRCNCNDSTEVCDKSDGTCQSGCKIGHSGSGCQVQCRCADPNERCDPHTGSCQSGCAHGWVGSACHIEIPALSRPPQVESRTETTVTVRWRSWRKPLDIGDGPVDAYIVYYRADGALSWQSLRLDGLRVRLTDLAVNTLYTIKISPIHRQGFEGFPSPELNISTCGKPASGPVDVTIGSVTSSNDLEASSRIDGGLGSRYSPTLLDNYADNEYVQLHLHWNPPTNVSLWGCDRLRMYKLYTRPAGHSQFDYLKQVDIAKTVIADVDAYENSTVGVTVINNAGFESDISTVTYIGCPSEVVNFHSKGVSPTELQISWSPPERPNSPVKMYVLRYKEVRISDCDVEHSVWSTNQLVLGDETVFSISDLRPDTHYQVRIWAESDAGKGRTTTHAGHTLPTVPEIAPSNIARQSLNAEEATFTWDPLECEERNGESVGFRYEVTDITRPTHVIAGMTNLTFVRIDQLTPYTAYLFKVAFVNKVDQGPYSPEVSFTTLQGRPPPPAEVVVVISTADSLTVTWEHPNPPHGILTNYEVKYWSSHNVGRPELIRVGPTETRCNISRLVATTGYGIQVRAFTQVGAGDWSPVLYGYTEEAKPDPPQSFTNISRTHNTITLAWSDPKRPNGILQKYRVLCSPVTLTSGLAAMEVEKEFSASIHNYTLVALNPGTEYVCTLRASTKMGYGEAVRRIFWTYPRDPEPPTIPVFDTTRSTDHSVAVFFQSNPSHTPRSAFSNDIGTSVYQVVVEKITGGRSTRSAPSADRSSPCNLPHDLLLPYTQAKTQGFDCYIAAQMDELGDDVFVVGNNKSYGGYYNAPLERSQAYDIWLATVHTVDGVTAASYAKTEFPAIAEKFGAPEETTSATMMIAGAGVAVLVAIILIIIIIAVIISRRRYRKREPAELILPVKPSSETELDGSVDRPLRPPRKFELEGHNNIHMNGIHSYNNVMDITKGIPLPETNSDAEDEKPSEAQPLYSEPLDDGLKPVSIENLWNYVKEKKNSKTNGLKQEYDMLIHGLKHKCDIARRPENKLKNRYGNIVAYDHSRVVINVGETDYINADYIDGYRKPKAFIATQGPTKHTVNDLWEMTWQHNSHRIVMVTNLVEDGRKSRRRVEAHRDDMEHKCEMYWPEGEGCLYGNIYVQMEEVEQLADFTIRTFKLTKDGTSKFIHQFHFTAWPDHGVPSYATSLLAFRRKVRSYDDSLKGPIVVHCSAGVGRTGTFISIDALLEQARVEGQVDIFHWVENMRNQRVNMVQTLEQYIFVYDALLEALTCGETSVPCVDFRRRYAEMCQINDDSGKARIAEEFDLLAIMSPSSSNSMCRDAFEPENIDKNRCKDIVPIDNTSRPYLVTYVPGATSDYINAVFCDGYKQKDAYVITQMPLPHTVCDFWTMVHDFDVKTIVMMNIYDNTDQTSACYWPPDKGCTVQYGPYTIENIATDVSQPDVTTRDFSLTFNKKAAEPKYLRHFQYHGWPEGSTLPMKKSSLLRLLGMVEKWQQRSMNGLICVHCMNGASRSGLFCAVSYMLERLKLEQEVDVFQSTKHIRVNRPQLVNSMDQYQYLYEVALEYMDSFDAYANFK